MGNNVTIGIFTVKNFAYSNGKYYTYGGFGNYIIDFSKYFKKVILLAHVIEIEPPYGYYLVDIPNIEIVSLPPVRGELQVLLKLRNYFKIAKNHIHKMDIIEARMPDYSGIVGAILAKKNNKPLFNIIIDDWYLQAKSVPFFKKLGLGALLKVHLFIYDFLERKLCKGEIVLAQGKTCYQKHVKNAKKCYKILSSAHQLKDITNELHPKFSKNQFTILNVGRLNTVKNQQLILHAVAILNKNFDYHKYKIEHVGEGSKKNELLKLAKKLNIESCINFNGRVKYGKDLWYFFDKADCFVLSSTSEGTPKVLLEACARGLPIIASDVAGVTTTIKHNKNGYIFPSNDINELVKRIKDISENKNDRYQMRLKAIQTAKENTLEYRNKEMISIISKSFPNLNIECPLSK